MSTLKAKQFHLIEDMDIAAWTYAVIERVEAIFSKSRNVLRTWMRRSNDRRMLAMMSQRMLNDIGLSNLEVEVEISKYFWQK